MKSLNEKMVKFDINRYEDDFLALLTEFEDASTYHEQREWFIKLNDHRFVFETHYNHVRLQHFRDQNNEYFKNEFAVLNKMESRYQELVSKYYRSLLATTFRSQIEEHYGEQLFRLAELKQNSYSKLVEDDLQKENQLLMEYQSLLGNAVINFSNQEMKLSAIAPYLNSSDRSIRKEAHEAKYRFFMENEKQFDQILDQLIQTRNTIARKLGYTSFIELGYQRMNRTSHTPTDLTKYRLQVETYGVPFISQLRKSQKQRIGVEKLKYYDEGYLFPDGTPAIKGSHQEILPKFRRFFGELSTETKEFFDEISSNNCMD